MASTYELKMPFYLAMSKGDLIAEIIEHGEIVRAHLASAHQHDTPTLMSITHPDDVPRGVTDSREVVRIANACCASASASPSNSTTANMNFDPTQEPVMAEPVHHDVEKFEAQCRATMAKISTDGHEAVSHGIADRSFIVAQDQFIEARVQFACAQLKGTNLGCADADIVSAAALSLGTMYGALLQSCNGNPMLLQSMQDWFAMAVEDTQALVTREGVPVTVVKSSPVPGGHA